MIDQPVTAAQVVPTAQCAVLILDEKGAVISSSAPAQELLGMSGEELALQYCRINPAASGQTDSLVNSATTIDIPLTLANADGKNVIVRGTCVPLDAGAVGRLLTMVVLDQNFQPAPTMDNLKSETLTAISHEIRTPLCTIIGYLEMLSIQNKGITRRELARIVQVLRRSSKSLEQATDNLIYALHILAGHFGVHPSPIRLADLLTEAIGMVEILAASRSQSVRVVFPETHATVWADRSRVLLVLANLLSTAIRHSPQAGIVTLSAVYCGADWQISVTDSSQGESWWEQARTGFEQDGAGESGELTGAASHFGMAVARYVVEQHGGTMGMASSAGSGNTSWFTLPSAPSAMVDEFSDSQLRSA